MTRRWNGSVAALLRLTFTVLLGLIVLMGTLAVSESLRQQEALQQVTRHTTPMRVANLQLRSTMGDATRGVRNRLIHYDSKTLYLQARARHRVLLEDMESYADNRRLRSAVRTWRGLVQDFFAYADRAMAGPPGGPDALEHANGTRARYEGLLRFSTDLESRLAQQVEELYDKAARQRMLGQTLIVTAVLVGLLLAGFTALRTYRVLLGPLGAMDRTLRRITAGDLGARAPTTGPVEICTVATAINAMAEEPARLRRAEEERARLAKVADDASARIRRTLDSDDVVREAAMALGAGLPAGAVYVQLISGEQVGPAEVEWRDGALVAEPRAFPPVHADIQRELYRNGITIVGSALDPPEYMLDYVRDALRELGDVLFLMVPFGAAAVSLGTLTLTRPSDQGPWTDEEIAVVKAVGADLGRGLEQARLYAREKELVDELRALDAAKTDFMSTVSHELRSPLTSIAGYVELLRDEDAGDVNLVQDRMLDAIERNTTRLRILIEDLLTLSRIESGAFRSVRQPLDVCMIVEAAVESLRPAAAKKEVHLTIDCPPPVIVDGDANQIDRAVVNLVSNAIKFTPAGGRVELKVDARDGACVLTIADTGIGIPAAEMQRMTDRFFRASNATALSIPGTGLGLSIVRSIVANHSGTFELDSAEGVGTTVTVRIPLTGTALGIGTTIAVEPVAESPAEPERDSAR